MMVKGPGPFSDMIGGSWNIAPTTISFGEIESAKSDIVDWWTQYRAGMTAQDYRIQQLSHKIAWMVQHAITACEGANMAVYTASVYLLPGAGPLAATAEDGAAATAMRQTWAWAAATFGGLKTIGASCQ
jgi:hypothetical protein